MPAELELRRSVALTPRGVTRVSRADFQLLPSSTESAAEAFARARELTRGRGLAVTLAGAERSFESHFLPRGDAAPSVVVSSKRLRGCVELLGTRAGVHGDVLRVRALAGTSFGELCQTVHATGAEFMPFSCPSAEAISLGGAFAVNTHGRTSSTYGGLFAEHVTAFRLVDPSGRVHDCRADSDSELERVLFRTVPGALGALGLVTDMELELCAVSPRAEVVVEVLEARVGDPIPTVRSYLERVGDNAREAFRPWTEGLSLVFFGAPARGTSMVIGRRRGGQVERRRSTLPLFRESSASNLYAQAFSNRFPAVARALAARLLRPGRSFRASYYRWAFFNSSHDECAVRLERRKPLLLEALGFESTLGLVHQAWVVASSGLEAFVGLVAELLEQPEYAPVVAGFEFFDMIALPRPTTPLEPSHAVGGDAHVSTLSIAVHEPSEREVAEAFCRELSERAYASGLPVVVQLNKQHHVEPSVLRAMHRSALEELARVKDRVDPDGVLGSRTLERLGF